ncbi:MAG: DNA polymerase I [Fimbriimonadia bacterium]|nr:DNA polymerase I [Fimbriimonadia bacterium]
MAQLLPRKLLIIDGHSLLYRGFFATRPLSTVDGRPTNAVYSFMNMLLSLLESEQPDSVIVAFDTPGKTFRHEEFEDYKANRRESPDEFRPQVGMTKTLLEAFGIPVLEAPGYEADDIVGTLSVRAKELGYETLIFTGDMDQMQLVNDHVKVRATVKGTSDLHTFDANAVKERYGFAPDQVADYKALKGDPSDNIPGVPGIGDKTALKLLQQFGHVEKILEQIDEVDPKTREKILQNVDQMMHSKRLATILLDIPLELEGIPAFQLTPEHLQKTQEVLEDYEFRSVLRRLPSLARKFGAPDVPMPVSVRESFACKVIVQPDERALSHALASATQLSLRIQGDGAVPRSERPALIAISVSPETAYALPLESSLFLPDALQNALENLPLIAYDVKRDLQRLRHWGLVGGKPAFDALIAAYLLQPSRSQYPLQTLVEEYLGQNLPEPGPERLGVEAAALLRLQPEMLNLLEKQETRALFDEIEMPLTAILADMEWQGVRLDTPFLQELSARLQADLQLLAEDIYKIAGEEFNIGSPKQLGAILFEKLGLPSGKKTKTGSYSTDSEVLMMLAEENPIVFKIVQYRELSKIRSTYAEALPRQVNPETGRLHTSFNQTVAATGRLSSSDPNLQNIPIRTDLGREIRRAFIADPGCQLLSLDYSQIELRILAHMSGDSVLVEAFEQGKDIHSATAAMLFNTDLAHVNSEMRRRAKMVNYAVLYGMSDFGLANELGISVKEAHQIIEDYFHRFPQVRAYTQSILEEARAKGWVSTLMGRKRYIPELSSQNRNERLAAERAAINTPFQGTAADIMKVAMIRAWNRLKKEPLEARILLQVHDELLLEAHDSDTRLCAETVAEEMEQAYRLNVPLTVERKAGMNWRDMEPIGVSHA